MSTARSAPTASKLKGWVWMLDEVGPDQHAQEENTLDQFESATLRRILPLFSALTCEKRKGTVSFVFREASECQILSMHKLGATKRIALTREWLKPRSVFAVRRIARGPPLQSKVLPSLVNKNVGAVHLHLESATRPCLPSVRDKTAFNKLAILTTRDACLHVMKLEIEFLALFVAKLQLVLNGNVVGIVRIYDAKLAAFER